MSEATPTTEPVGLKKYSKIKRIGHERNAGILDTGHLIVQEKLDGANFRFALQEHLDEEYHDSDRDLVFGSRNVVYKNEKDIDKAFTGAVEYVRETLDVAALRDLEADIGPVTLFGEAMHPHTLEYDWERVPRVLGFGVYNHAEESYLWASAPDVFETLGLDSAPVLYDGVADDYAGPEVPDSAYRDGVAEGIVIKNTVTEQVAKLRSEAFKEAHGTENPQKNTEYDPSDAERLAWKYTTEARVLKLIHKYEDRGRDIEMGVMEDLWREVFDDIIEEEYDTIFLGEHVIDTKAFRSEVANLTADHLKRYLSRPDGSVLNEPRGDA
jgi:hypothetical protein